MYPKNGMVYLKKDNTLKKGPIWQSWTRVRMFYWNPLRQKSIGCSEPRQGKYAE